MALIIRMLFKLVLYYLVLAGIAVHLVAGAVYFLYPDIYYKVIHKLEDKVTAVIGVPIRAEEPLQAPNPGIDPVESNFGSWTPESTAGLIDPGQIRVGDKEYPNLSAAVKALKSGDTLLIGEGVYHEAIVVEASNVHLRGNGRVILDGVAAKGKAAIITNGENISIRNIECRNITVPDGNGACIRHQGVNLDLEWVYFHDSQQGLLSGNKKKLDRVTVKHSRFENLGHRGKAHGIYVNGGHLKIQDSLFISSKDQAHEIKSRAVSTEITKTVVASLNGKDSRLIDISNGGRVLISDSVLEQGPASANMDMIGFGLEKRRHEDNLIVLEGNTIILERKNGNRLLHLGKGLPQAVAGNNIVIGGREGDLEGSNFFFSNRADAGIKSYPFLPPVPK